MRQLEAIILKTLTEQQAVHVIDLSQQIDEHPVAVDQACARLHDQGYLTLSNHGVYDVTDQGRNQLDKRERPQRK
jgi:Mn-dependent DtxR family transcriptional regulator